MRRIVWATPALADIETIEAYLDEIDPAVAGRIVDLVITTADRLSDFPAQGPAIDADMRSLAVPRSPYRLVYRLDAGRVEVLRIRHVREDWRES